MKNFYKNNDGSFLTGTGIDVPEGFIEYEIGKEPSELLDYQNKTAGDEIKKHISYYRRTMENGGVEVNGMLVQTDSESRSNLLGASQLGVSINWKTKNGFVELTSEQIQGIAFMVGTHVQKCFNAERVVYEAHDKNPFTSKEDVEKSFNDAYKNN